MSLTEYIRRHGIAACASKWGMSERRVKSYLYGERMPRPADAGTIIDGSGGVLNLDSIYGQMTAADSAREVA